MTDDKWTLATVAKRTVWDEGLFTSQLDLTMDFTAGQFAMLGLDLGEERVKRAYSIASKPGEPLEFFIVQVDGGRLTPCLWCLQPGQPVWVWHKIAGTFTADRVHQAEVLWLIGTGTGIAPYISMLREGRLWERFGHVVLVQGARTVAQLGYRQELEALHATGRLTYVPTASRESGPGVLRGRIPDLFDDGQLEAAAGRVASAEGHQVMLCGNPEMVKAMLQRYHARDMLLHTPRRDGNVHVEKYW